MKPQTNQTTGPNLILSDMELHISIHSICLVKYTHVYVRFTEEFVLINDLTIIKCRGNVGGFDNLPSG